MRHMVVDVSDHLLPVSVNSALASEGQLPPQSSPSTPYPRPISSLFPSSPQALDAPENPPPRPRL